MPTTFIGSNGAASTTVAVTAHQTGDLIVMFVIYSASLTPPAGWTFIGSGPYSTVQTAVYYKFATSTSDASGTWTGAAILASYVYRQAIPGSIPPATTANGNSASVDYPDLAGQTSYLRLQYPAAGSTLSGWNFRTTPNVRTVDALDVVGPASSVGANSTAVSSQAWVAWTIGLSPAPAGNPGAFFQFF
ncbi:hypothetical protein [Tsukamurella tyrosinosolvens]|uniref:hypothetical protein n=1 Tax=Tsukamurella tyrosinosolvens TaxID=57704 RepID=UPI002DD44AB2|nr:hypothetical protein [Tsukamurella tyrosinosolvens]MEC4616176.1 hypothetical protein [Tsukamurella tyrosinosolvens]